MLEVLDVAAVLLGLGRLRVDDGDAARLGHPLARAPDQRLVDPLLHDLVADVVGAVHVEALLVEAEADRERRVLDQDQVRRLERHRQPVAELVGAERDPAGDHELPESEIPEVQRVEAAVLEERGAGVDLVVHAVGLLLLEIVRAHGLRRLLLEVEVGGDGVGHARHALLEQPPPIVDGGAPRVERGPVRVHARANGRPELLEVVEQALDVAAQERDHADLVARAQAALDLRGVAVHAVAQLVERRQRARPVRGVQHLAREPELAQEVGLDRERALRRGAPDVRERVERVDALEDDRLDLRRAALRGAALDAPQHGPAEPPLHDGVDRGAPLLDERLDAPVQLLHAPLDGHREQGQDLGELRQVRRVEVAGARRAELERADHLVLVEERRDHDVAHAALDDLVLDAPAARPREEVLDHERLAARHRALVDRARELRRRVVPRVGEDAAVLVRRAGAQDEYLVALERGEAEAQLGPPEERPELRLEALEARRGDDRLLLDQVALDRGEDLLVRDLDRAEHREPAEEEALGREDRPQMARVEQLAREPAAQRLVERRRAAERLDFDEAPVEVDLEVALESRVRVGDRQDERVVHHRLDAVDPEQDQRVRVDEPHRGERRRVQVHAAAQRAVRGAQQAVERRRAVEALELERHQRRAERLVEERGREDRGHQDVHELAMARDHGGVGDRPAQLGGARDLLADDGREGIAPGPEGDQRREAQLGAERKAPRVGAQGRHEVRGPGLHRRVYCTAAVQ